MSAATTAMLRYLDSVHPELGQRARALHRLSRSVKFVYSLADSYHPAVGQEARRRYAEGCKAVHQRDVARIERQVQAVRARIGHGLLPIQE